MSILILNPDDFRFQKMDEHLGESVRQCIAVCICLDLLERGAPSLFEEWADTGRAQVATIGAAAEARATFGVSSFIMDNELFWGREHSPDIRALLGGSG
jgi:hypothetical protein